MGGGFKKTSMLYWSIFTRLHHGEDLARLDVEWGGSVQRVGNSWKKSRCLAPG